MRLGLGQRDRPLRITGLAALAIAAGRLVIVDLAGLPSDARIVSLVGIGLAMLAMSFGYTRFRERLARWL